MRSKKEVLSAFDKAIRTLKRAGYGVALLPLADVDERPIKTYECLLPGGASTRTKLLFARQLLRSIADPWDSDQDFDDVPAWRKSREPSNA